jgi:hypothetical protein
MRDTTPDIVNDVAIIIFADRGESERTSEESAQFDVSPALRPQADVAEI